MKKTAVKVVSTGPGKSASLQSLLVRVVRSALLPWKGRGLGTVIDKIGAVFPEENFVVLELGGGRRLKVHLFDGYWLGPLLRDGRYEPEIAHVLDHVLDGDSMFVDCGANVGYWSVWSSRFIRRPDHIVAIEASPVVFAALEENAALNDHPFRALNKAVWSTSGETVTMPVDIKRHAWGSVAPDVTRTLVEAGFEETTVSTITIDDAVETELEPGTGLIVLKLDVEGVEREALEGASSIFDRNVLVIYEDHARDEGAPITQVVMTTYGFDVFYCDAELRVHAVPDPGFVRMHRPDTSRGYNYFACRPATPVHEAMLRLTRL